MRRPRMDIPPTRLRQPESMPKITKRKKTMCQGREEGVTLDLPAAVAQLKKFNTTQFDQSVEVAMRLGIDPKQADQIVRGSIVLPHGIGRTQRVVVFARGAQADEALEAGADIVGQEDLAEKIKGGWTDFDACIAAPDMMRIVGPLGKILGPRGLMPSPRAGTVTPEVAKVVAEYKAGKVEFRNDSSSNVHAVVGKLSFDAGNLAENIEAFITKITVMKPANVKGTYIKGVHICASMSPSVKLAI